MGIPFCVVAINAQGNNRPPFIHAASVQRKNQPDEAVYITGYIPDRGGADRAGDCVGHAFGAAILFLTNSEKHVTCDYMCLHIYFERAA